MSGQVWRPSYTRLAAPFIGLAVIGGALWLAFALPTVHCVYGGDAGNCQDRSGIKIGIGILGVLVGALILYVGAKMED